MQLTGLRICQLRNLYDVALEPAADLNLIVGPNASGKTALLEAIYLLARGRSFRTNRIRELIQREQERLQVTARLSAAGGRRIPLGLERNRRQTLLRYDGTTVKNLSEHARRVPLILITPDSHGLVSGRPGQRRRWLDWALFHVEPEYLACWQNCFHALRQRNALLKYPAGDALLASWEDTLATYCEQLDTFRRQFLERLNGAFGEVIQNLLGGQGAIEYRPGRDESRDWRLLLAESRSGDRERGFTQSGPHRSDLDLRHAGLEVRSTLSRGQTKLYIAGLMLAYARVLAAADLRPLILVDDLPAELDENARQRFMAELATTGCQTFVTAIDPAVLPRENWGSITMFHVERGCLAEVIQ